MSFLDLHGLQTFKDKLDTLFAQKLNISLKGAANGLAELDSSGKVPSSQLPSYVDDVLEYENPSSFPATGETGKIYVATSTNKTYRWSGTAYVEISASLALGETSSTAYRGDRGKTAYDHAAAKGSAFTSGLYKITTNAQGHVTAATTVAKADITALGIPASDTDVRNTAGATDTSSKIYLIGATSQAANPQTYSHDTAYVGTDGCLYSGGKKVLTESSTLRDVPFGIGTGDWTVSGSNYVATVTTAYVTSTSREWVTFTDTFRSYARGDINVDKVSGGGGITLTTAAVPTGTIQGTLYIIDADDGKVPVLIEGTVTPIANGGTGQSTLSGAQSSLGITALSDRIDTLNSNMLPLSKLRKATIQVTTSSVGTFALGLKISEQTVLGAFIANDTNAEYTVTFVTSQAGAVFGCVRKYSDLSLVTNTNLDVTVVWISASGV